MTDMIDTNALLGLTIAEAKVVLAPLGIKSIRENSRDGKPGIGTADHRTDRLQVETLTDKEGVVRITRVVGRG